MTETNAAEFDFVDSYIQLFSQITDAPEDFKEACALFLVSTAVGRKFLFRSMPEAVIFADAPESAGRPLNLWLILIGKSRISRKSTVVERTKEAVRESIGKQRILSDAFTPEALVKQMAEKTTTTQEGPVETNCCWIADEISWFFSHLKKHGSYMETADSLLSQLYDGRDYSRETISRGGEVIAHPFLTCLLASTDYLPTLFNELGIRLGFMNRFIYVLGEREERKPLRTEPLTTEEKTRATEINAFLKALVERKTLTVLVMSSKAKERYDSYERTIEDQIANEDLDIKEGYCGQLPNLVVRLSCLFRISRMTPDEIKSFDSPLLIVELCDVERAIAYAQKAWEWFDKVLEIMQAADTSNLREKERMMLAILEYLVDGAEKHVNGMQKQVLKRVPGSPATFHNARAKLVQQGRIVNTRRGFYQLSESEKREVSS